MCVGLISSNADAGVMNGDFESFNGGLFDGWNSPEEPAGSVFDPFLGIVVPVPAIPYADAVLGSDAQGNYAILKDLSDTLGSRLFQRFTLPAEATALTFEFAVVSPDVGALSPDEIPDLFDAVLFSEFDAAGVPQSSIGPADTDPFFGTPAFYSISRDAFPAVLKSSLVNDGGSASRAGWTKIVLDLSGLPLPRVDDVALQLTLDDGFLSSFVGTVDVYVDNVQLIGAPVPEPTAGLTWAVVCLITGITPLRRSRRK